MSALVPLVATCVVKSYGDRVVLDGIDLVVNPGQPTGLVGENGVGKSTLLRLLVGVEEADDGVVSRPGDLGYVAQELAFPAGATVDSVLGAALAPLHDVVRRLELLSTRLSESTAAEEYGDLLEWASYANAWDADARAMRAAASLGLSTVDRHTPVERLSGGQRSRLALAALVARQPACVVLDEPTNHLDDGGMEFLESFLRDVPGVVLVASHDRVFLDRVCSLIVDLDPSHFGVDGRGGNRFGGGFSEYLEHKRAARLRWEQTYASQQEEIRDLRRAVNTTARTVGHSWRPPRDNDKYIVHAKNQAKQAAVSRRVRNAEGRLAALEREQVRRPAKPLTFRQSLTGSTATAGRAVVVRDLEVAGRLVLPRMDVGAGEHLLVTGDNGTGKSTLLAVMAGRLAPDSGSVAVSARQVGYLPQEVSFPDPLSTPMQVYEASVAAEASLRELGLLHPRDLARPLGVLSVGQRRRLALAILVARAVDLLLLDEPTNHISLTLATELEDALQRSPGTVVVASHDRWLRRTWSGTTATLAAD